MHAILLTLNVSLRQLVVVVRLGEGVVASNGPEVWVDSPVTSVVLVLEGAAEVVPEAVASVAGKLAVVVGKVTTGEVVVNVGSGEALVPSESALVAASSSS